MVYGRNGWLYKRKSLSGPRIETGYRTLSKFHQEIIEALPEYHETVHEGERLLHSIFMHLRPEDIDSVRQKIRNFFFKLGKDVYNQQLTYQDSVKSHFDVVNYAFNIQFFPVTKKADQISSKIKKIISDKD